MRRDILPDQPLRLSKRYRKNRVFMIVFVALCAAAVGVIAVLSVQRQSTLDREQEVWDHGTSCNGGRIDVVRNRDKVKATVTCVDGEGLIREIEVELHGAGKDLDPEKLATLIEVRYDPADPKSIAIDFAVEAIPQRRRRLWIETGLLVGAGIAVALFAVFLGMRLRRTSQLARSGDEQVVHIERVLTHVRRLESSAETAVQMHFSAQSHRTNSIMRTLTVLTAIFLPLNLVTGFFGMNFDALPLIHSATGFWIAAGLMLLLGIGLSLFFWRKKYLGSRH